MKNHFLKLLLGLSLMFLCFGCKKEKDKEQDPIDILTSKTWKFSLVDKNPSSGGTDANTISYVVAECFRDNIFEFKKDGTVLLYTGKIKCIDGEQDIKQSTYSYNRDTKEISIDGVKSIVLELTKTQFKYKAPLPFNTGYSYALVILE